jgi:hypothetical protein
MERVPIAIISNGEVIGYLHDITYVNSEKVVDEDRNLADNRKNLSALRNHIIKNPEYKTKISYRGNGFLIKIPNNGLRNTAEALPDKNLTVTIVHNGKIKGKTPSGNILNADTIGQEKNGTEIGSRIIAIMPVNDSSPNDNLAKETQYIAVPLAANRLQQEQATTLT